MKWYRKVAFELLSAIAIVNAHVIYNQVTQHIKMTKFRESVCNSMIFGDVGVESDTPKKYAYLLLTGESRKNCVKCYKNLVKEMPRTEARKKVRRVKTFCVGCPKKPMCKSCHIVAHSI